MGEGLELAKHGGIGGWGGRGPAAGGEGGEETGLCGERVGAEAGGFAGGLERGEIDVGGEVLAAGSGEEVRAGTVLRVGAERAVGAGGREEIRGVQAVIEGEKFAVTQGVRGVAPPRDGGGADFGGEAIGQHGGEFGGRREGMKKFAWLAGQREARPDEIVAVAGDAPLEPLRVGRVPAEAAHGKGVEEFVGEDEAVNAGGGQFVPAAQPADFFCERLQRCGLPGLAARGGLEDEVFEVGELLGAFALEPGENVARELAVVRAGFDELERLVRWRQRRLGSARRWRVVFGGPPKTSFH